MSAERIADGTVIGGAYRIVRPLSAGGMGEVYIAEQLSTGKQRALKLMHHRLQNEPKLRERFVAEARVASKIDSLHAVEIIGAGVEEESGTPWIAMELLEGDDLGQWLRKNGALEPAQASDLLEQICHAVGEGHDNRIVHRDLKPENVFIAKARAAGQSTTVKVLDFGIAKLVADTQTMGTAAIGSPAWMAPEQAEAGEKITPATDVWALGLLTYWMLTGRSYWRSAEHQSASMHAFLKEVLFEPLPLASERAGDRSDRLPEGFDAWFERCVHREPRARFKHARELFESFGKLVAGDTDAAEPADVESINAMSTEAYLESISEHESPVVSDEASQPAVASEAPSAVPLSAETAPAVEQATVRSAVTTRSGVTAKRIVIGAGLFVLLGVLFVNTFFGASDESATATETATEQPPKLLEPSAEPRVAEPPTEPTADEPTADEPTAEAPVAPPAVPRPAPTASASAVPEAPPFNKIRAQSAVARRAKSATFHCKNRPGAPAAIAVTLTFNNDGSVNSVGMDRMTRVKPAGMCVYNFMKQTRVAAFSGKGETVSVAVALQ